ncbi:MAG: TlpA disulfide reductase family protein [Bacteroidia bacterium]|nr:TlpA disulfide reductase family protein [Bacteroidia bacterium]
MKTLSTFLMLILWASTIFSQNDSLRIDATLTGFEEGTYLYLWTSIGGVGSVRDSAKIKNGTFRISYLLEESPSSVFLTGKGFNPNLRFYGENKNMSISGDKENFSEAVVKGSKVNDVYLRLRKLKDNQEEQLKVIEENLDVAPALTSLYFLKDKISAEKMEELYQKIPEEKKGLDFAKRIASHIQASKMKVPEIGDDLIDFEVFDEAGKTYTFSDLNDRFLLIEFGSSFCGPCYAAAPELSKLQEEEQESLKIISFSLDSRESLWKQSLERLHAKEGHAKLLHLWDGEGENGIIPASYGVSGIPQFYLINPEGRVVAKWMGYEEGIVRKKWEETLKP